MIRRSFLALVTAATLAAGATGALAQDAENVLVIDVDGTHKGTVEIELLPAAAPQHVARIKELARAGAYDGVVFHRVIDGFMAQTGDVAFGKKDGDLSRAGTGGSDMPDLPAEFSAEPFEAGTVGMARAMDPNSANSQFFIMFKEGHFLNGQYTVWGRVTEGMDHVDAITRGEPPASPDRMVRVRVAADE